MTIARALDAAHPAPAASAWRPIATAPKDGSKFIVGWNAYSLIDIAQYVYDGAELRDAHHGDPFCPSPTHWQPLPAPPAGEVG